MKVKILFKIKLLLLLMFVSSCEVLDETPFVQTNTENYYQNADDAIDGLTSAYARLKSGNGYYKQKYLSTIFAASDQGLSTFLLNNFKNGTVTSTDPNIEDIWKDIYVAIRDANNVIANVPNIDMDEVLKSRIIGEAKFLRALHYFNLVRCFGEVPLRVTPVEASAAEQGLEVSSISEIYDIIIGDLEAASNDCWDRNQSIGSELNNIGRVTKAAANALLAKVYLRMASCKRTALGGTQGNLKYLELSDPVFTYYEKAKNHCNMALEDVGFNLVNNLDSWVEIFAADNGNNPEMLFDVQGSDEIGQGTAVSNLFTPRNAGFSGTGFGGSNKLKPRFINFHLDKNDTRYQNSIIKDYQTCRIFQINNGSTGYIAYFPISCSDNFTKSNDNNWPYEYSVGNTYDSDEHIVKININKIPEGGASWRLVEITEDQQFIYHNPQPLSMGINILESSFNSQNRNVIFQFNRGDTCFSLLEKNDLITNTFIEVEKKNPYTLWQVWTAKYIDTGATTPYTSRQNWHIIRLADVYLMRAEALAELNENPGLANQDINALRSRVGMANFDGASLSMDAFRTALLKERAVELYMEGHRFFDLTRFGVYDEYCSNVLGATSSQYVQGAIGQRQPEDYTWPIPISETAANSNIN